MVIATHLIKIKGIFNKQKWTEKKLKKYIDKKIREINSHYHSDLELFRVKNDIIEVWIFIFAFPSEVTNEIILKWFENHIKEGIVLTEDNSEKAVLECVYKEKTVRKNIKNQHPCFQKGIVIIRIETEIIVSLVDYFGGKIKKKMIIHLL